MFNLTPIEIIALVIGFIEVVIRVVPTVSNNAPVAITLKILTAISDFLTRKKLKK